MMSYDHVEVEDVRKEFPFGTLYRAHHAITDCFVFQFNASGLGLDIKDLTNGLDRLSHLESACFVKPLNVLHQPRRPLSIVYERCPGATLDEFVPSCRDFSLERFFHIAGVAAAAILQLHLAGLVHGYIAARNTFIFNESRIAMILCALPNSLFRDVFTQSDINTDMEMWMSPERRESGTYSQADDIWAFGMLLWEILSPQAVVRQFRRAQGVVDPPQPEAWPEVIWQNLLTPCWRPEAERPSIQDVLCTIKALSLQLLGANPLTSPKVVDGQKIVEETRIDISFLSVGKKSDELKHIMFRRSTQRKGFFQLPSVHDVEVEPLPGKSPDFIVMLQRNVSEQRALIISLQQQLKELNRGTLHDPSLTGETCTSTLVMDADVAAQKIQKIWRGFQCRRRLELLGAGTKKGHLHLLHTASSEPDGIFILRLHPSPRRVAPPRQRFRSAPRVEYRRRSRQWYRERSPPATTDAVEAGHGDLSLSLFPMPSATTVPTLVALAESALHVEVSSITMDVAEDGIGTTVYSPSFASFLPISDNSLSPRQASTATIIMGSAVPASLRPQVPPHSPHPSITLTSPTDDVSVLYMDRRMDLAGMGTSILSQSDDMLEFSSPRPDECLDINDSDEDLSLSASRGISLDLPFLGPEADLATCQSSSLLTEDYVPADAESPLVDLLSLPVLSPGSTGPEESPLDGLMTRPNTSDGESAEISASDSCLVEEEEEAQRLKIASAEAFERVAWQLLVTEEQSRAHRSQTPSDGVEPELTNAVGQAESPSEIAVLPSTKVRDEIFDKGKDACQQYADVMERLPEMLLDEKQQRAFISTDESHEHQMLKLFQNELLLRLKVMQKQWNQLLLLRKERVAQLKDQYRCIKVLLDEEQQSHSKLIKEEALAWNTLQRGLFWAQQYVGRRDHARNRVSMREMWQRDTLQGSEHLLRWSIQTQGQHSLERIGMLRQESEGRKELAAEQVVVRKVFDDLTRLEAARTKFISAYLDDNKKLAKEEALQWNKIQDLESSQRRLLQRRAEVAQCIQQCQEDYATIRDQIMFTEEQELQYDMVQSRKQRRHAHALSMRSNALRLEAMRALYEESRQKARKLTERRLKQEKSGQSPHASAGPASPVCHAKAIPPILAPLCNKKRGDITAAASFSPDKEQALSSPWALPPKFRPQLQNDCISPKAASPIKHYSLPSLQRSTMMNRP